MIREISGSVTCHGRYDGNRRCPAYAAGQCQGWVEAAAVRPAAARAAGQTSPAARAYPALPVPVSAAKTMP